MQLNTDVYKLFSQMIYYVFSIYREKEQIDEMIKIAIQWIIQFSGKEVVCAIDEAQSLFMMYKGYFKREYFKKNENGYIRGLLTPFLKSLNQFRLAIILATYHYEIVETLKDILQPSFIKSEKPFQIFCFSYHVQKDKLIKNDEKSNPLFFYFTKIGNINKEYEEHYKLCMDVIQSRFKDGKLKSIIRIHISLPDRSESTSGFLPKNCISYQTIKIRNYEIPSIVIDISGSNIEDSGIFSKEIIKILEKKSQN